MRHIRFEVANRLIESLGRLCSFRWKELERKRGRIPPHNIANVHGLAAYIRSSRDFRSTHRNNIFNHVFGINRTHVGWVRSRQFLQTAVVQGSVIRQRHSRRAPVAIKFRAKSRTPALETLSRLLVLESLLRRSRRLRGPDRDW